MWSAPRGAEALIPNAALSGPGTDAHPALSPEPVDADPASLLVSNSSDAIFSSCISRLIVSSRVISCEFSWVSPSHFWASSSMSASLCCRISSLNSFMFLSSSSSTSNASIFSLSTVSPPGMIDESFAREDSIRS